MGKSLDELQHKGLLDRTLIKLASDHGEPLREQGANKHSCLAAICPSGVLLGILDPAAEHPQTEKYIG